MRLSKQYKNKLKKRVLQTFGSIVIIALTLTVFKLADFSMLNNAVTTISGKQDYIKSGEKYKINFTDDSTGKPLSNDYTWTSYNQEVAEVNAETGIITAKSVGKATIVAENKEDGTQKRGTVNVYSNNSNAITVPQVKEGDGWTVVLKEDGTVWAAGANDAGQIAQGDNTHRNIPVQVKIDAQNYLTNVVKISSSYAHTMALTADGKVYTWGNNGVGQLGVGDTTNRFYATKVKGINGEGYLEDITDISMGYSLSFAVNKQGELFGWGQGDNNWLLGEASTYTPVKLTTMADVVSVTTEYDSVGVTLSNGETWIWGDNYYGALGNGTTSNGVSSAICLGNDFKEISFGGHSGYFLKKDGTIWSSGYNNYGQLGVGDTTNRTTFTQVVLADGTEAKAKTIKAGTRNLQFIGEDGKVYITGYNGYGQLTDGTTTNSNYPIVMKNEDGTEVTDAVSLIAGMHMDGSNPTPRNMGIVRKDGTVWLVGDNTFGQLGNETTNASNVLTKFGIDVGRLNIRQKYIKIDESFDINVETASEFNVLLEKVNQDDFTWESYNEDVATVNNNGIVTGKSVGYTTIIAKSKTTGIEARAIIYVTNKGDNIITVPQAMSTQNGTMLILKENGEVWGSGVNTNSELAQGDAVNKAESVRIKTDENTYLENIVQIQAGEASGYALDKDGNVFAWGWNGYGQLGLGDTANRTYATKITSIPGFETMPKVLQISSGQQHLQILLENGEIYSAGRNVYGSLGNENHEQANNFVKTLRVENIVYISSQQWNNMFLTQSGKILMCGHGDNGELGNGSTGRTNIVDYVKSPDGTSYLEDVVSVASSHAPMAITKNGKVYTWGYNGYGQIGDGTTANKTFPVEVNLQEVGITKPKYVATAKYGNVIQDVSGKVYAIGCNDYGRLAISLTPVSTNTKYMPMLDEDGNPFEDALIISNSVAQKVFGLVSTSGNVYVAGYNEQGQFGNGTYQNSYLLERYGHNNLVLSDRQIYMKATTAKQVTISNNTFIFNTYENTNIDLEWSSSDEKVATVSQDGTITGVALGNCTIIAKDKNSGEESRVMVHVYNNKKGAMAVPMVTNSYDTYGAVMVLKEDGTVWATGYNANGELGQGNTIDRTQFVQVKIDNNTYLDNVVKVNYGWGHAIALTKNGKVYTWGWNTSGQLGLGDTTNRNYATKVTSIPGFEQMPKVIDVTAGYANSSLILEDGTVYTTGSGDYSSNGDGTSNSYNHFVKSSLIDNAISMECDEWQRIVLDADGTVWAFGRNYGYRLGDGTETNRSVAVHVRNKLNENNLKHVISVKTNTHSVAILEDKTTVGWGYNYYGNLGNETASSLPIDIVTYDLASDSYVQAKNIKDISTDYFVTMMIDENGNLLGAGLNDTGNLSIGNTTSQSRFVNMLNNDGTPVTDALFLSKGYSYYTTSIIRKDGTVWTAGTNSHGQYGDGTVTTTPGYYFTKAGTGASLNVRQQYIKIDDTFQLNVEADDFNVFIQEDLSASQYHWSSYNEDVATVDENGIVTGKSVGHTTIIAENKQNGVQARAVIYVTNKGDNVITVPSITTTTNGSILVLKENGEVWGSGVNSNSELAQGDTTNRAEPVRIKTDENTYLENIIQLEVGQESAYALDKDGNVFAWGYNEYGQLGLGDTANRTYATQVTSMIGYNTMPKIIQISGGCTHFQVLLENGEVYSCRKK